MTHIKSICKNYTKAAKDFSSAKKYYKMAADLGNEEALEIYNRLVLAGY